MMKTIISANIPIELAIRLKDKTKGTRSRVIERALRSYLDEKEAYDIGEVDTRTLFAVLHGRDDVSPTMKAMILAEMNS